MIMLMHIRALRYDRANGLIRVAVSCGATDRAP